MTKNLKRLVVSNAWFIKSDALGYGKQVLRRFATQENEKINIYIIRSSSSHKAFFFWDPFYSKDVFIFRFEFLFFFKFSFPSNKENRSSLSCFHDWPFSLWVLCYLFFSLSYHIFTSLLSIIFMYYYYELQQLFLKLLNYYNTMRGFLTLNCHGFNHPR